MTEEKMDCPLCEIMNEKYRLITRNDVVYATIPIEPIVEGHVMVAPIRHTLMEDLKAEELVAMNHCVANLKNRLVELYPRHHPTIVTYADTDHASVPSHYHIHLIPSDVRIRTLISNYNKGLPEREVKDKAELERMAEKIR